MESLGPAQQSLDAMLTEHDGINANIRGLAIAIDSLPDNQSLQADNAAESSTAHLAHEAEAAFGTIDGWTLSRLVAYFDNLESQIRRNDRKEIEPYLNAGFALDLILNDYILEQQDVEMAKLFLAKYARAIHNGEIKDLNENDLDALNDLVNKTALLKPGM